jgi:hypothetical protein
MSWLANLVKHHRTRRRKPLSMGVRTNRICPYLERLEQRINPGGGPPSPPNPQQLIAQPIANAVASAAPSLPVIGPALQNPSFIQGLISNMQVPPPSSWQISGTNPESVHIGVVQTSSSIQVPFNLSMGSFLTLSTSQQITLYVDLYYDLAFNFDTNTQAVTMVDTSLKNDGAVVASSDPVYGGAAPKVTTPDMTAALVLSATVPSGFQASGTLGGQLNVSFTDAGTGGSVGLTRFSAA